MERRRDCEPFADVDHVLYNHRQALCRDLGQPVPAGPDPADGVDATSRVDTSNAAAETACADRDPVACFWAADWANRGLRVEGGKTVARVSPNPERAIELFRRSCAGGHDNGCLWLAGVLRDTGHQADLAALVTEICTDASGRLDACASIADVIPPAEQPAGVVAAVEHARQALAGSCVAGRGAACMLRARMEPATGAPTPWLIEACKHGSADGCVQAPLSTSAIDEVRAAVAHACAAPNQCRGLLTALRDACGHANAAACYLTVNACLHDERMPRATDCHPSPASRCAATEEPPTPPASCLPKDLRGRLLIDERARGEATGWRAYELCRSGMRAGYLLEHAGPQAATPEEAHGVLDRHRGALDALGAFSTALSAGGVTGMFTGDLRVEKVLPQLKRWFTDVPEQSCFGVALWTWQGVPVPF